MDQRSKEILKRAQKQRADVRVRGSGDQRLWRFRRNWETYQGQVGRWLRSTIVEKFTPEVAENLIPLVDSTDNVMAMLCRRTARNYMSPPARFFEGMPFDSAEVLALAAWVNEAAYNSLMLETSRLVRALGVVLVRYRPTRNQHLFAIRYAFDFVLSDEDERIVDAVLLPFERDNRVFWEFWTDSAYAVLDDNRNPVAQAGDPWADAQVNPYGVIPWAALSAKGREQISVWDSEFVGDDLFDATMLIGLRNTYLNDGLAVGGKQPYIKGERSPGLGSRATRDARVPLEVGVDADIGVFDLMPDVGALTAAIDQKLTAIARNYGISPQTLLGTGDPQSAIGMKLSAQELVQVNKEQRPTLEAFERDLLRRSFAVGVVDGAANPELRMPPPAVASARLDIAWQDLENIDLDKASEATLNAQMVALGVKSPIDVIMQLNTLLTREQATAQYEENLAWRTRAAVAGTGAAVAMGGDNSTPEPGTDQLRRRAAGEDMGNDEGIT